MSLRVNNLVGFGAGGADSLAVSLTDTFSNASSTTPETFSARAFGNPATSRRMFLCITYRASSGRTITAVTIGGQTATQLVAVTTGQARDAQIWVADVPSGATGDIVITSDNNLAELACSLYRTTGLSTATTADATATDSVDALNVMDVSHNTLARSVSIACGHTENSRTSTWSGLTEAADFTHGTSRTHTSAADVITSAETPRTVTHTWSASPSNERSAAMNLQ